MGRWHAKAIQKAGGRLLAIVDNSLDAAGHLTARYRHAKSFTRIEEMLDKVGLDVLHVCTPAATHKRIADLAIDTGLNLLIEKPMTLMASDTEYLFKKAADRGVLICPVHQFLFQEGVRKALKWLPRIGRPVHVEGTICSAGGTDMPQHMLDRIVADILPHPLSLMQVFLSEGLLEKDWVTAQAAPGELRAFTENSGIFLSIFTSMHARPTVCSFKIAGTEGTIHVDLFHGFAFIEPGKASRARKIIRPFDMGIRMLTAATVNLGLRVIRWELAYPGLQGLVNAFYKAVQINAKPPISPKDAITVARVREILIQNAGLIHAIQRIYEKRA